MYSLFKSAGNKQILVCWQTLLWEKILPDQGNIEHHLEHIRILIIVCIGIVHTHTHTLQTNTFQCILVTNGRRSFAIFLYADGEIQWTTGDLSGGSSGFGGTPAQVGFNAGDGLRFASVPGSQTSDIVNIDSTSNVDRRGVWIFRIDEEEIDVSQECRKWPHRYK